MIDALTIAIRRTISLWKKITTIVLLLSVINVTVHSSFDGDLHLDSTPAERVVIKADLENSSVPFLITSSHCPFETHNSSSSSSSHCCHHLAPFTLPNSFEYGEPGTETARFIYVDGFPTRWSEPLKRPPIV